MVFGQIPKQIQKKRETLSTLVYKDKDGSLGSEINMIRNEINELLDSEEIMWHQRSKVQWLGLGDLNTKYFHTRGSDRRRRNTINSIMDENGNWHDSIDGIAEVAMSYFKNMFSTSYPTRISEVLDAIPTRVTEEMNQLLIQEFTREEVKAALKQMHPTKTPGPNVLANRLKIIIPQLISENQSAFLSGRLITDNVLVAFELMHYLEHKKEGMEVFVAIKLDMSKAYDRVEWGFIKQVMEKMGFHEKWIKLIMHCITSVSYSILVNGVAYGNIIPTRGLRQGDPISPYIFLLCADGFSSLINDAAGTKELVE
ncbi:uncharacterized protein LOC136064552 [Quercus suber]|uniref:uncharacterized protein LOC136064552 n=1 Tax=Quercus suber TaxID=58331 RepID=UPI0032E05199